MIEPSWAYLKWATTRKEGFDHEEKERKHGLQHGKLFLKKEPSSGLSES